MIELMKLDLTQIKVIDVRDNLLTDRGISKLRSLIGRSIQIMISGN